MPTEIARLMQDAATAFERLAAADHSTQFEFQPVQQAIGTRLNTSTFVAVTSSQIDPACIIERWPRGQGGYLWNYELPGTLGAREPGRLLSGRAAGRCHAAGDRAIG